MERSDARETPMSHPRCGRRNRQGQPCGKPATLGPNGEVWPCRHHGGAGIEKAALARIRHGGYVKALRGHPALRQLVQAYEADPDLLRLDQDIAFARALLHRHMERLDGAEVSGTEQIGVLYGLLDRLTRMIQRREDIAHAQHYIATDTKVAAWMGQAAALVQQVLERYVPPGDLAEAKAEVARGIGVLGGSPGRRPF